MNNLKKLSLYILSSALLLSAPAWAQSGDTVEKPAVDTVVIIETRNKTDLFYSDQISRFLKDRLKSHQFVHIAANDKDSADAQKKILEQLEQKLKEQNKITHLLFLTDVTSAPIESGAIINLQGVGSVLSGGKLDSSFSSILTQFAGKMTSQPTVMFDMCSKTCLTQKDQVQFLYEVGSAIKAPQFQAYISMVPDGYSLPYSVSGFFKNPKNVINNVVAGLVIASAITPMVINEVNLIEIAMTWSAYLGSSQLFSWPTSLLVETIRHTARQFKQVGMAYSIETNFQASGAPQRGSQFVSSIGKEIPAPGAKLVSIKKIAHWCGGLVGSATRWTKNKLGRE